MTTFNEQMVADLDVFFTPGEFVVDAVFTSTSNIEFPGCSVDMQHDVVIQPSSFDVQIVETGSTITALCRDVGVPEEGSFFTIDGEKWITKRVTDNDNVVITMAVVKNGN